MTSLASLSSQLNKAERLDRQYGELLDGKNKDEEREIPTVVPQGSFAPVA